LLAEEIGGFCKLEVGMRKFSGSHLLQLTPQRSSNTRNESLQEVTVDVFLTSFKTWVWVKKRQMIARQPRPRAKLAATVP
jgi:hypothetical protein